MSDLVGNPKDRFSHDMAQLLLLLIYYFVIILLRYFSIARSLSSNFEMITKIFGGSGNLELFWWAIIAQVQCVYLPVPLESAWQ